MGELPNPAEQLAAIADHFVARKAELLACWRKTVEADPLLTAPSSLPRTQFDDHIPHILDALAERLRNCHLLGDQHADNADGEAAEHGLQRWQHGYQPREVSREWGHLHVCLVQELEDYAATRPPEEAANLSLARKELARLAADGISESIAQFFELQRMEAIGHLRDLQKTISQVEELDLQRAELWRQAAHDLRGNVGTVAGAAHGLTLNGVSETMREEFLSLLQTGVDSLRHALEDMMSLARLQAGHEQRVVESFDASALLHELCRCVKPLADEKGLSFNIENVEQLTVEGDAAKTRRIAQNLLLNAIKYTNQGGLTIAWGDSRENDADRWMLRIQDTGPGFHAGPGAPLAGVLKEVTRESQQIEREAGTPPDDEVKVDPPIDRRPIHQERGEGVGLSIVMRLCELLDATVELESKPDQGTTFRVLFPRRYDCK